MHRDYTTLGERRTATRLVAAALAAGYTVSVYDGEEYPVKRSRKSKEILEALASTEEDWLVIRDGAGERLGSLRLIWGNDQTGEELIADYTDKPEIEALANAAQR
jgi:hypothetical protein